MRSGTADVYAVLDAMPEIADSLLIGVEEPDGYWMPLFVVPAAGGPGIDANLTGLIRRRIASEVSRRHVSDEVITVPAVPRTRTGKRLEVPVKRIFQGNVTRRGVQRRGRCRSRRL